MEQLDGSVLITDEYRVSLPNQTGQVTSSSRIFVADTEILLPDYIQANQTLLRVPIVPRQCQAPIPYIMGTKWYAQEMLHLSILQDYDYFIKLDTDVVFLEPLPIHLLHDMTIQRAIFGHTGEYPRHITAPCGMGITKAVKGFLKQQGRSPNACSANHPALSKDADLYYTNFIVGRTDYFQSTLVLELSRYLSEYPQGFFHHRWTDQIFWHFAMGLFVSGSNSTCSFEDAVVDYSQFRCAPKTNCWMSVHYYNQDRCDNGGVFFHTKAKQPSNQSKWRWREEYTLAEKGVDEAHLPRSTLPFPICLRRSMSDNDFLA